MVPIHSAVARHRCGFAAQDARAQRDRAGARMGANGGAFGFVEAAFRADQQRGWALMGSKGRARGAPPCSSAKNSVRVWGQSRSSASSFTGSGSVGRAVRAHCSAASVMIAWRARH
jgi:hypothetical protein